MNKDEDPPACENCNGWGEVTAGDPDIGIEEYPQQCAVCEGTGIKR